MDFFRAVFSDDPPPSSDPQSREHGHNGEDPNNVPDPTPSSNAAWSFGGLIKTIASKSESVIDDYRRDLEEFGSGLKKETAVIREVASRAVKDLPASLDVGASVAQESLESVGQALDDIGSSVWQSTPQIISHGKDTILNADSDSDSSDHNLKSDIAKQQLSSSTQRYSRFDVLVRSLQSDMNTYLEEPEDLDKYNEWKLGFELDKKEEELRNLFKENGVIEEIYEKVNPSRIDHETFWRRYYYKLHKLEQAEDARAKLVKRAISEDDEEDLSWDFDDDDDGNDGYEHKGNPGGVAELKDKTSTQVARDSSASENIGTREKDLKLENEEKSIASESEFGNGDKLEVKDDDNVASHASETVSDNGDKLDEKAASEAKTDNSESCKDSDISVVSSQPSMPEEEDLGWDEMEDIGNNDENKGDASGVTSRIDLRKRLSAADPDEDLSWDIEDDDEPIKSLPNRV